MQFYENFLRLCNNKGVAPTTACVQMGLDKTASTRWSHGLNAPSYKTLVKIGDYFGVNPSDLLTEDMTSRPSGELYLTAEEISVVESYRKCTDAEKDVVGYLLSKHGFKQTQTNLPK